MTLVGRWQRLFPDRYFLELHRTGRTEEEDYLHAAVALAQTTDLPVVATNDVRFLKTEDFEAHEARVCIQRGRTLDDPGRPKDYSPEQYLRSPAEMAAQFEGIPEALDNSVEIARRCNLELSLGKNYLPAFPVPDGSDIATHLQAASEQGLRDRFRKEFRTEDASLHPRWAEYFARLEHAEVGVRQHAGIPWRLSEGTNGVRAPAPLLGADTDDVLREVVGCSASEIAALREAGVVS